MRAAVCRAFAEPLAIEDVTLAPPGPGEIGVRTAAVAICQSDIHYMQGAWGGALPAVYGHEASGVVEEVGAGVEHVRVGDHVVVTLIRSCGRCRACVEGAPVFCEAKFALDALSPLTGSAGEPIVHGLRTAAFAQAMTVHASQAVAVPKTLPLEVAALIACGVITGMGAVLNTAGVRAGDAVVVIGAGGVGLNSVQAAALAGANPVIAVDLVPAKLDAARRFGATHGVDPTTEDVAGAVGRITGGSKADHVFVTVGARAAIESALGLIRRAGTVTIVGMPAAGVTASFDPGWLAADGQRILGSKMGSARIQSDVPKIVALYERGRVKLDELVTGRYPLDAINDAVASVGRGEALRNVVVF